ncbi:POTRA domain-containing protein [Acidicapsa dinghuensis]|uniref:POTRA domain-containing protein n=1 Tax=Acidicapsa dinghuensis TaxID=2218256 RepID=A0ABW1EE05_9BACT|nr:outer membrane protein assembly factor [Acidicapsa dinghuensis]
MPKTAPFTEDTLSSYEGQTVTRVEIAGRPDLQFSQIAPLITQHAGESFSADKVQQSLQAVKTSGKYKEVQLQLTPDASGVRVIFVLEPAVYIGLFEFPGAQNFAYSRLVQVSNYEAQAPYNAEDVKREQQSLLRFFRQEGYFQATVDPEVKFDADHDVANIVFHVDLKHRAEFGSIVIAGATPEDSAKLNHDLQTFWARLHGAAIRPGKRYNHSTINHANNYLEKRLAKQGNLAADVKLSGAEYHASTNRADIHFIVKTGPVIDVEIKGAHLFSWTRKNLLPMYQGIPVDDESIEEGRQALLSYFQSKGYFNAAVGVQSNAGTQRDTVVYTINKEKKHRVPDVQFIGNKNIAEDELRSHVPLQESHFLSHGKYSEKLVRDSVKNIKALYQSEGFSDVAVVSKVKNDGGDITVSFHITEGQRDIVRSLTIDGADTFPRKDFAPDGLKLAEGKPYSQSLVESDRASIIAHYLQAGYLTSSFRQTATVASKNDRHHIDVVYHIYEGPRVYTGAIETLGRSHTQQRLIDEDVNTLHADAPMTESALLTAESRLYNHTGIFDWAEVDPKRSITTQTKEDAVVKVHEAQLNQITYGLGFEVINRGGSIPSGTVSVPGLPPVGLPSNFQTSQQTFYGPRGSFQYTRNNMRGKGESFSFTAFAGRLDQRGAMYYIDPNFFWSKWRSTFSISYEKNEENPIYSSQQELGSYQVQRTIDHAKADTVFFRYSFSKTNLTRVLIQDLVLPQDRNVRLSTLAANFTRDTRDNPLDAHKGMLDTVEIDVNDTHLGSSVDFAKLTAQAAYYKSSVRKIVFANSLRIGLAQPYSNSRVPLSEAFFTGGGNTLRGYPLDGAGPQRSVEVCPNGQPGCNQFINVPSGGNELLLVNSEARIPLPFKKGLGLVVFYDGGNVFPNVGFHNFTSLYSNNVGLGLRYNTPVGPVRVDIGHNLNPVQGINSTQYFVSIGQAF